MKKQSSNVKSASQQLKVGFVFDDSLDSFDGVSQYVKTVGGWLSGRGHKVSYLVGETKIKNWAGGNVHSLSKNQKVSFNKNRLSIPLPSSKNKIKKILAEENYDVLHIQMPYSPFLAGRVLNLAAQTTAILGTFHILPANRLAVLGSKALKLFYLKNLKRFDTVFSVSEPAREYARDIFSVESEILPNVVEISRFKKGKKSNNDIPKIIFLGRLVERKGCFQLLKAFKMARKSGLRARLVIAGIGPERSKLERFVASSDLAHDVEFMGFIDEKQKPDLLAAADIACFPATSGESFGIVLIEAMAAGSVIVLGGDNPGYRSVLGEKPVLLINPLDTNEFAKRLKLLLSDKNVINDANVWLQSEINKYDVNNVGRKLEAEYFSAIAKRLGRVHNVGNESG